MNFNDHLQLVGQHAFLSASKYHWINYDDEKLITTYGTYRAAQRGTEMHDLACRLIKMGVKLPKTKKTLNMYVNDAIGFKMTPEQPLYFSDNCFGTADTINFKNNFLRIHDYKSGESAVSRKQLLVYSALFCLEYHQKPSDIEVELRIYQSDNVDVYVPDPADIYFIMEKIIRFDKLIDKLKIGG